MGFNIARLTLYAILSSIEEDMRVLILFHLEGQLEPSDLLGQEVYNKCKDRLIKDQDTTIAQASIEELLIYTDFAESYQIINSQNKYFPISVSRHFKEITPHLAKLVPIRNRVMHSRPLDFADLSVSLDAAKYFVATNQSLWNNLNSTLLKLESEPTFVFNLQIPIYTDSNNDNHNLPIPDFDETGFIGREKQVDDLIKLCLGPYPVITIVGNGGIGKTAIALKVAYEILDKENCPYEAIVWTSSKTSQLTAQEIVRIEGAICDSLGMLQKVSDYLAGSNSQEPLEEVLTYLGEFKILLILDNLETVLDDRIRSFLERLPMGSKVLITSRIGLGAFEYPVKLEAMSESDAINLLRATARIRGVENLGKMPNKKLAGYCNRMKKNPGYIKWFLAAVQAGKRPEEVLAQSDMFLDFCMSNVYEYLAEDSRKVLQAMLCVPGQHSQAELTFLSDMDVLELQRSVQELLRSNMVIMSSTAVGSSFESHYALSDLARAYLAKHYPVNSEEHKRLTKLKQRLIATNEEIKANKSSTPYSYYNLTMRSRSDLIVAKYLMDAINKARSKKYDEAEILVGKARNLAPEYFEVHRVEALVKVMRGNLSAAQSAYEAALELEPTSAPLKYWYGGFLMRSLDDCEEALKQFKEAARIDPNSAEVQVELARANLYLKRFDETREIINLLLAKNDLSEWTRRKAYDLHLQFFQRKADHLLSQYDYVGAFACLEKLKEEYQASPKSVIDQETKRKLGKASRTISNCIRISTSGEIQTKANQLLKWLNEEVKSISDLNDLQVGQVVTGRVQSFIGFGVLVDIGRVVGLLHISEVSAEHVEDLTAIFSDGDDIKVLIINVDSGRNRVSLSTKQLEANPGDMLRNPQLVYDKAEEIVEGLR
jgi:tetratricopeptide (TPR) repeat protein